MNVLQICSSDNIGGAAKACYNINKSLIMKGVNSNLLVHQKIINDDSVKDINKNGLDNLLTNCRVYLDYILIKSFSRRNRGRFTIPYIGTRIINNQFIQNCDIINLHWINGGFLSLKSLQQLFLLNKPVVWTFHDMWAFTGGCHYTEGCLRYMETCKNCPSLNFRGSHDLSNVIFKKKEKLFGKNQFNIITCSTWLAKEVINSHLLKNFPVDVVPNPIDLELFKPYSKNESRKSLSIPANKIIFLFSSFTVKEIRKGFNHLKSSLLELHNVGDEFKNQIELIVLGAIDKELLKGLPFKTTVPGRLNDKKLMAMYYSAADLFIAPSIQENLSNTVMESLSCGTPVLAFNIGGMPDMINHLQNGYLASTVSSNDLLDGMLWFINLDENTKLNLRINARKLVVDKFSPEKIANKYIDIYEKLLKAG